MKENIKILITGANGYIGNCLYHFLKGKFKEDCSVEKKEFTMAKDYYRVLNGMWEENCIIRPTSFKKTLKVALAL